MNRSFTVLILLLVNIFVTSTLFGDWRAVYYKDSVTRIIYSFQDQTKIKPVQGNDFVDDFLQYSDPTLSYKVFSRIAKEHVKLGEFFGGKPLYYWYQDFDSPLRCLKDTTFLYISIKAINIKQYFIYVRTKENQWYFKKILIPFNGYQQPGYLNLKEFEAENHDDVHLFNKKGITFSEIASVYLLVPEMLKDSEFLLNNLILFNRISVEQVCIHPFLDSLFNTDKARFFSANRLESSSKSVIISTQETNRQKQFANYFMFISDNHEDDEKDLVKEIMVEVLKSYPFYKERNLNPEKIKFRFDSLLSSLAATITLNEFEKKISCFIKSSFNDGHFYLNPPFPDYNGDIIKSPLRLYEIENKFFVVAVFDTNYCRTIPVGSEVLSINNHSISKLIDSLSNSEYGTMERRRSSALSKILDGKVFDSTLVSFSRNKSIEKIWIKYDGRQIIPENFKNKNAVFNTDGGIAYFRAGKMDGAVYLRFKNYFDNIIRCKGIIIDLRGNPGGSSSDGENIFSCFIDKPRVYRNILVQETPFKSESQVIRSNQRYSLNKDFPVVIIGDENTACASEEFINAMQQLENCYFISSSRTCGALQSRYGISFPSGAFLSLDCLSPKILDVSGKRIIECEGIDPDIWISKTNVEDLAPYNDLLLKSAEQIINNY